jgi:hypothetical protein
MITSDQHTKVWINIVCRPAVSLDSRHQTDSINQDDFNTTGENKKPGTGKQFDQLLPCAFLWKSTSTS